MLLLLLVPFIFAISCSVGNNDDVIAGLCEKIKELNKNWIVPVDPQTQLILNLCGFACKESNLCLTDLHRKPVIEFSQPTVSHDKLTYFLNFASLENTKSSDGFPFLGQLRLVCEEDESEDEDSQDGGEVIHKRKSELGTPGELDVKTPLYQLTWRSTLFCEEVHARQTQPIAVFVLWLILTLLVLYFFFGALLNLLVRNKRGGEVLPHYELFSCIGKKMREFWENLRDRLNEPYVRVNQNPNSVPGGFA